MTISRRQVLVIGGLGVLGAGAAMVPTGSVEAKSASHDGRESEWDDAGDRH